MVIMSADKALKDTPNPIEEIQSMGKLKSDPDKIKSSKSLKDFKKIKSLYSAYLMTSNENYKEKLKDFILAWAAVNVPSGHPVNDTKFEPFYFAYDLIKKNLSQEEKALVKSWLNKTVQKLLRMDGTKGKTAFHNFASHRLKVLGLAACCLGDSALLNKVVDQYKIHLEGNLFPDGTSIDFQHRDALYYHCYNLEPLLVFAIITKRNGIDLYNYSTKKGASLIKSLDFLAQYCDGTKKHAEFVNSTNEFDRQRAAAGEESFASGNNFDISKAVPVFESASYFDKSWNHILSKIEENGGKNEFSWKKILNMIKD